MLNHVVLTRRALRLPGTLSFETFYRTQLPNVYVSPIFSHGLYGLL
jgi:hypothetical protein